MRIDLEKKIIKLESTIKNRDKEIEDFKSVVKGLIGIKNNTELVLIGFIAIGIVIGFIISQLLRF